MSALKMAAPEKERILAPVKRRASRAADPITDLIAHNGAQHYREKKPLQRNHVSGRKNSCSNEQGIAGKQKTNEKAGFHKNDRANERSTAGAD